MNDQRHGHGNDHDGDLRDLLRDTAAGITPHGTFDEIRERTMNRNKARWIVPAVAAAAVMALVVGGLGWMLRDDDRGAAPAPAVTPTADATGTPDDGTPDDGITFRQVDVFYVGQTANGPRLFSEKHRVDANDPAAFGYGAVGEAMTGNAHDPDYSSPWADAGVAASMSSSDTPGVVDISINKGADLRRPAGMSEQLARLALEQLVRTYQAGAGSPVKLRFFWSEKFEGGVQTTSEQITKVFGIDTTDPLGTRPDDEVMAPVQITSLTEGQKVPAGTLRVEGGAATFEANVVWEVRDAGGAVVRHGFTTAAECCTLAPYAFDVDLPAGTYTVTAHDTDESGSGRPVDEDTKRIVVG